MVLKTFEKFIYVYENGHYNELFQFNTFLEACGAPAVYRFDANQKQIQTSSPPQL